MNSKQSETIKSVPKYNKRLYDRDPYIISADYARYGFQQGASWATFGHFDAGREGKI